MSRGNQFDFGDLADDLEVSHFATASLNPTLEVLAAETRSSLILELPAEIRSCAKREAAVV
jgi:hypothetical protein